MQIAMLTFAIGILARVCVALIRDFQKKHMFLIGGAILMAVLAFIRFASEEFGTEISFLAACVFFVSVVSFGIKDRILPKITEGTLLLYALVSLYVIETHALSLGVFYGFLEKIFIVYSIAMLVLCIAKIRIHPSLQVFLVTCFLLSNLTIMIAFVQFENFSLFCEGCEQSSTGYMGLFFAGYMFFQLLANLLFVLYFIPMPLSKSESFSQRIENIKKHAHDLERQYIDIDVHYIRTLLVVFCVVLLIVNHSEHFIQEITMIGIILTLGELFTESHSRENSGLINESK